MNVWRQSGALRGGAAVLSVVFALVFSACGSGGGTARTASRQAQIALTSPSMVNGRAPGQSQTIPVRYTCDGSNTTPAFRWGAVPPNTAQLVLFMFKLGRQTPTGNGRFRVEIDSEWAIADLPVGIHEVPAGKLPPGAVVAGKRYSICPPKGKAASYLFQINALSRRLAVRPHFSAVKLLQEVERPTVASGTFVSSYKRA